MGASFSAGAHTHREQESAMAQTIGYSRIQIALHWAIALGVTANYIFSDGMPKAIDSAVAGNSVVALSTRFHVLIGLAVLALVVLRIGVRLTRGAPPAEAGLPGLAAHAGHGVLYLLMVAVPIGGAVAWFLQVETAGQVHGYAANALIIIAGAHSLVALYHHFILKDGVLRRMLRPA
jgi:cytochrome b561